MTEANAGPAPGADDRETSAIDDAADAAAAATAEGSPPSSPPLVPPPDASAAGAPPSTQAAAWRPPDGSAMGGRRRGCIVAAALLIVVTAIAVSGFVALVFLGGQVREVLKGTVEFGTGGSGCTVTGRATTFPASSPIHIVAYLQREVQAGEVITLVVTVPDGTTQTRDESPAASTITCVYLDIQPGLAAGHYGLEYRANAEVLSKGAFDITP